MNKCEVIPAVPVFKYQSTLLTRHQASSKPQQHQSNSKIIFCEISRIIYYFFLSMSNLY